MGELFWILLSAMLVNNFTLHLFLGLCPFMGVSAKVETALRMGLANIFVLVMTSVCVWLLNTFILVYAPYLQAHLVHRGDRLVRADHRNGDQEVQPDAVPAARDLPAADHHELRDPRATRSSTRTGATTFSRACSSRSAPGLGLTLALVLMASIRETSETASIPAVARNMGLVLIIAGSLSLAFMGFAGLFTS